MKRGERGDTIIEVMFSFVILSLLVVATYMVMNRGTQIAQRSLEITLVRQQIDSQVSLIRYAQTNNTRAWQDIRDNFIVDSSVIVNPTTFVEANGRCPSVAENDLTTGRRAFFLAQTAVSDDVRLVPISNTSYAAPQVYSQINFSDASNLRAQGIFIQVTRAESNPSTGVSSGGTMAGDAYDVYVNACWDSVGTAVPSTIGTITRIYDGRR